jgi:hypothetical protein
MSLMLRIGALVLFLVVLIGKPMPVTAYGCPSECHVTSQVGHSVEFYCIYAMCIDIVEACNEGTGCMLTQCYDLEGGLQGTLYCE